MPSKSIIIFILLSLALIWLWCVFPLFHNNYLGFLASLIFGLIVFFAFYRLKIDFKLLLILVVYSLLFSVVILCLFRSYSIGKLPALLINLKFWKLFLAIIIFPLILNYFAGKNFRKFVLSMIVAFILTSTIFAVLTYYIPVSSNVVMFGSDSQAVILYGWPNVIRRCFKGGGLVVGDEITCEYYGYRSKRRGWIIENLLVMFIPICLFLNWFIAKTHFFLGRSSSPGGYDEAGSI